MKKLFVTALLSGLMMVAAPQVEAVFIVDTGTPTGTANWSLKHNSDTDFQYIAGQFTTTEDYVVTSLEGYIRTSIPTAGVVDAVLFFDNAGSVDLVGEIFRQSFNVPGSTGVAYDWRGLSGLNIDLNAGTYWLGFETAEATKVVSAMQNTAPSPLAKYALRANGSGGYVDFNAGVGMRIGADPVNAVPEPMSMMLFGTGLAGAALRRKFSA